MNSFGLGSNSAKTIDCTQKVIDSYLSKNVKNRLKYYNKNNKKDNSTKKVINNTAINFHSRNNVIKNNYNKLTPSCLHRSRTKYGNFFIFGKRELAFHKSIKEGRKVFKYHQSTIDYEDPRKARIRKINSLYLTETLIKRNKTMLPLIDKDKSIIDDINISNYNIMNRRNKKDKDILILNNIKLNNERQNEIKKRKDYLGSRKLVKKNDIISKHNIKEKSFTNYINNMKEYLIDKYTLDIKNEKYRVIQETNKNKIERINDKERDLKLNCKSFLEDFYPSFNEYIKKFIKQREIEKQKDIAYLNKIYYLQKKISMLKNKINKCQNEKEHLMKEMFLQICIKEKKLNLPEYYKDILSNNYSKNEIKEKYGVQITEKEIDRILEYKNNLEGNEEEILFEKLKRLENDNIELLNNYDKERYNILYLKKQKKQVEEEIKKESANKSNNIDNMIYIKEKVLENIIKKYKKLKQDKAFLSKKITKKKTKHTKLYYKVQLLFLNLNSYIKLDFSKDKEKIKGELTEEIQILQIIKKIETITAIFFEKNRQLLINNSEEIKSYKNMIAKKKKIEKTNEQRRNIHLKFEKERKKIFDKYNKILFLQRRKIPIYNIFDKKLINIQKSKSQQRIKVDTIGDHLYDLKSDK